MPERSQKGWLAGARSFFSRAQAKAAPAAAEAGGRQVTVVIRPNVRDRWSSTLLAYYTPERVEVTARSAMGGNLYAMWQMFDLMEQTWPELATCLNELKDQAIAEITDNYEIKASLAPGKKSDPEAARRRDIVQYILDNMTPDSAADENDFEDTIRDMMDDVGKCISVLEMNFSDGPQTVEIAGKSQFIVPLISTRWVNPRYYGWPMGGDEVQDRVMLNTAELLRNNPSSPIIHSSNNPLNPGSGLWADFPPDKFILSVFKQKSGHPLGASLLRNLASLWAMANFTWEWYLNFVQIFGVPLRIAKVDPNAPDTVKTEIDNLLAEMGSTGYIRLPSGNEIEIKEAMKGGNDSVHKIFLEYIDQICRKRILGQTLTGGHGVSGSLALGRVHASIRNDRICGVAARNVKTLNTQIIPAICRANFGDTRLMPRFEKPEKSAEDPLEKMQRVQIFTTIAPMSEEEIYGLAGFKVPEAGEKTIGGQAQPGLNAPGGVGTPKLPGDQPLKLNPEKDASTAMAAAAESGKQKAESGNADLGETLREMLLPVLDSVAAIRQIDDPALQQRAAESLLKNFPHLETVILHNKSLAQKLLPELTNALVSGLTGDHATAQAGDVPGHEFHGNQWTDGNGASIPMRGDAIVRTLKKTHGFTSEQGKALMEKEGLPKGGTVMHKADAVAKVKASADKIKAGDAPMTESNKQTDVAHRLFTSGKYGGKTYGLETHESRQSVGGVYARGGFVKEANVSPEFKADWETNSHAMRANGFSRHTNDYGQDTMQHVVPVGHVADEIIARSAK